MTQELPKYITHSVIFTVDPSSQAGEFLSEFCVKINLGSGSELLCAWCSEVHVDHPIYLEIVSHKPPTAPGLRNRIPHHMVLLIGDPPLQKKQIGFVQDS